MKFLRLSIIIALFFFAVFGGHFSFAQTEKCINNVDSLDLDELKGCQDELQRALDASKQASAPFESQLQGLLKQIQGIENRATAIGREVALQRNLIDQAYDDMKDQKLIFDKTVRSQYIKNYLFNPLLIFLASDNAGDVTRLLSYQKKNADQDKSIIMSIALKISDLEDKNSALEAEETKLISIKNRLATEKADIEKLLGGAYDYQETLSGQLAQLSARQQQIISERSGTFTVSIGDSDLADDYNASIKGFNESAPSGYFAVFSFGAYTHRKGMSQYGARGRAAAEQNYKQILNAYYGKEPVGKDTNGNIKVAGFGEMDFETTYLYGIAEMPSGWSMEALKAQAVAARTYAYRYKLENKEICTTEACQVFNKSKSDNVPDSWKQAVDDTKGQVLEDVVTYYASTHGGYASPIGWDTTDGGGGSNFVDKSYDKLGGSPWVYKAWYTKGYSPSSDKCGRSNPWLSPTEMADIVNAALVLTKGTDSEAERISPITTSCWGGNPYSHDELRNVASKYGGISSANSASVSQGNGSTNSVTINGIININGADFKKAFNLRAPGYLSVPQSGFAFFNIEHK